MMYFPSSDLPAPASVNLPTAERVDLTTQDGLTLGAWFVPARGMATGYTVIVFNGNAGHRGYRAPLADGLSRAGMAVLLFDYRGYGGNPGLPYEEGIARDARAALAYVRGRSPEVDSRRIVFFGESLGGAVAVRLASEFAPAALVLRSPFSSMSAVARVHFPVARVLDWLLRDRYDAAAIMPRLRSPLLIIAGDDDHIVPLEDSERLFALAREPKRLLILPGADHNDDALTEGPRVIQAVAEWLSGPRP